MPQHLGWIRGAARPVASPQRRRRMEGGESPWAQTLARAGRPSDGPPHAVSSPSARVPPWAFATKPSPIPPIRRRFGRRRRTATDAILAPVLRTAAGGARRRHLQQLVRSDRARSGGRRPGAALRADPLPQELDRHPLSRPHHRRARRRIRRARPHSRGRPIVGPREPQLAAAAVCPLPAAAEAPAVPPAPRRSGRAGRPARAGPSGAGRGRGRPGRLAARPPADVLDLPGRTLQPAGVHGRAARRREPRRPGLVVLPAVHPFGGRPRQDPPVAGGGAHRRGAGPVGDLSDGREVHVRFRRGAAGADLDRLQGAAARDRSADLRRRAISAGQVDPGRVRARAERPARRRARGHRRGRPAAERSRGARRARALAPRASASASRSARSTSRCA